MSALFGKKDAADTLMASGPCPVVNSQGSIPTPTAEGVCVTLTFPTNAADDFHATIDTTGVAHTAFFTAHMPTEFERDIHYLMQAVADADLGLESTEPNEPINEVPTGGGHDHGHRRLSTAASTSRR